MMTKFNLDTPEGRLAAIEALGPVEYNRAIAAHLDASVVATVNGHAIRTVVTSFGRLFAVGATGKAFRNLSEAKEFALTGEPQ